MKKLIFILLLCGCSNADKIEYQIKNYEEISEYEYDRARGHNAAIRQFYKEGMENMLIDLSNKRVITYVNITNENDKDEKNGYAEGYHNALNTIFPDPIICPR